MAKYFQTPNGYVAFEDDNAADPPEGSTEISAEEFTALVEGRDRQAVDQREQELADAVVRWSTVHEDLIESGVPERTATIIANAVGINPTGG